MTSALTAATLVLVSNAVFANPRLVFTPTSCTEGVLDGAWWPHTRVLSEELPALLAVVTSRFGPVARVSLNRTAWDTTLQEITCGDGVVQLVWYRACDADTIRLLGGEDWHLDVLVIPPDTAADTAAAALSGVALPHTIAALHAILTRGEPRPGTLFNARQPANRIRSVELRASAVWRPQRFAATGEGNRGTLDRHPTPRMPRPPPDHRSTPPPTCPAGVQDTTTLTVHTDHSINTRQPTASPRPPPRLFGRSDGSPGRPGLHGGLG